MNSLSLSYKESRQDLVNALTFACEKAYERAPESVAALDQALRDQRWDIFTRIRNHLYSLQLNEQTKPWIREAIIAHEDYDKWEHHFEFQRMIRLACEKFGADLLTKNEKEQIFKAVLSGPSEQKFRDWVGDRFTNEKFAERKRNFHRMQLSPFTPLLFGKYREYFENLKATEEKPVTDDDYAPFESEGGWGEERSPKSVDDLAKMSDENLLLFLNEWQNVHRDPDNWLVEIDFEALSQEFQSAFEKVILPDKSRLNFWIKNRDRLERPIYVGAILSVIQEQVKLKRLGMLDKWFEFCEWVLSHPDQPKEEGVNRSDESREYPDWQSSRRAVGDFVEVCLEKNTDVPISFRQSLSSLLDKLCTQYDRRLDEGEPVLLNRDDQLAEAINNTRSRALEYLVYFGYWVRRQLGDDQADTPEVFTILDKRFGRECERPLKLPEYPLLGRQYLRIFGLNREWAAQQKGDLFPRSNLRAWKEAFECFIRSNGPYYPIFEIVRDDFEFGLESINKIKRDGHPINDFIDSLGKHLFSYYVWEAYPLTGDCSLLEKFYEKTHEDKNCWSNLFDHVGNSLKNCGKKLEFGIKQRAIDYFDWRLERREPSELKRFTSWLDAECLDVEWRLGSYSRILDICASDGVEIFTQIKTLQGMVESHTGMVVECFAKLTDASVKSGETVFIRTEEAKPLIRAGLDSDDANVRENAERARENLLQCGRFEFLDVDS